MKDAGAVGEHRRGCLARVEPSLVDLADVCHEVGLGAAGIAEQLDELAEQLVVGDLTQ